MARSRAVLSYRVSEQTSSVEKQPVSQLAEKQRLNIARALVNRPEVLLLDEPTSALDPESARSLISSVGSLNRDMGITVIMVTHRREHAELLGGDLITMSEGLVKSVQRQ